MSIVKPKRFIGLDLHKYYLVAIGVDEELNKVYGPKRVELANIEEWIRKTITQEDALVVETTANAFLLYDALVPYAHSVLVVHPPNVALVVRSMVKTDKIAAHHLARLLAKGLLTSIWVPPQEIRDLRSLVGQRRKMTSLKTLAKNRLQGFLHRYSIAPPEGPLFDARQRTWWGELPISKLEQFRVQSDLATLDFAQAQIAQIEGQMAEWAAKDERVPILFELCGVGMITSVTLLAAIGDISRFPDAEHLVGYSGLGARVHDSGLTTRTGGITKAGQRVGVAVHAHRLRHTCATQLLNAGCPVTSIQKFLGHKNLNTTMIYARAYDQTVEADYFAAMRRVEQRLRVSPAPEDDAGEKAQLLALAEQMADPQATLQARRDLFCQMRSLLEQPVAIQVQGLVLESGVPP